MKQFVVAIAAVVLTLVGGLVVVGLGLPDVAATTPHWPVTRWVLSTTMENAVRRRAEDLVVPEDLDDTARIRAGAAAYDAMCVGCHGAPGVEPGILAEGLLPRPPELAEEAEEWDVAELFWITKHGVRMTGMPAFGPTHDDDELWEVAAFLGRLPGLSVSGYRSLVESAGDGRHGHGGEDRSGDDDGHSGHAH